MVRSHGGSPRCAPGLDGGAATFPRMICFLLPQRHYVGGVTSGARKG
ncbi:hypothetical protein [Salinactinospora qingdaonensis]